MTDKRVRGFSLFISCAAATTLACANGHIDDARQLYYHEVTDSYQKLVSDLESGNYDEARDVVQELHERTNKLMDYSSLLERDTQSLIPMFMDDFRLVQKEVGILNSQAGILEQKIGHQDTRDDVRVLKDNFDPTGKALDTLYAKLQDFGKRFQSMCDSCR